MFARRADDGLASFARRLEDVVVQNAPKKARATVVLLAKKDEVAPKLEAIAQDKKLVQVPLAVSVDGAAGPEEYKLSKNVVFTVVVYDKKMNVTRVLELDNLDKKAQDAALAEFTKVLGIEPPKVEAPKPSPSPAPAASPSPVAAASPAPAKDEKK